MYYKFDYDPKGFLNDDDLIDDMEEESELRTLIKVLLLILALIMLSVFLGSCKSAKHATVVVQLRDSIRTEVHTEVVYVPDTIPVFLPAETVRVVTPDTISRIETGFAISEAALLDGLLYHSIWNKQTAIDVAVEHKETTRDSIVYKVKEVPVEVPVEIEVEKKLTWWQQTRLNIANVALGLAALWLVWFITKKKLWFLNIFKAILSRW